MQAAVEGQGIALARTSLLANDLHNGLLVRLFDIEVPGTRKYFLVYPPRLADAPKIALFRQWLRDEIARDGEVVSRKAKAPPRSASRRRRQ
jgi:LysR family glycine cleavage system transcriptional activator